MYPKHDSEFITIFFYKGRGKKNEEEFYDISFPNASMSCVNSISLKIAVGRSDNSYCMKDLLFCCFNLACEIIMIFGCIVEIAARKEKCR